MKTRGILATLLAVLMMVSYMTVFSYGDSATNKQDLAPVKLKMVILGGGTSHGNDMVYEELNKRLSEDLNATLEVQCISWSVWADEYPLLFASGEEIDLVYVASWAGYASHAQKGAFTELTEEMLQEFAPNAWATFTPDMWDQTRVNGSIYMIPQASLNMDDADYVLIRGDLREKYGLPEIQTTEDLVAYWNAVKENESGILPIDLGNSNGMGQEGCWTSLLFADAPYDSVDYYVSSDRTMVFDCSDPSNIKLVDTTEYNKQRYEQMAEFRKMGYWSQDSLSKQSDSVEAFLSGTSATAVRNLGNIGNLYIQVIEQHPEWKPEIVDMDPNGAKHVAACTGNGMAIPATCKDPERALMVLDLLTFNKDYSRLVNYGIEGVHYEAIGENGFKSIEVSDNDRYDSIAGGMGNDDFYMTSENVYPGMDALKDAYKANAFACFLDGVAFDNSSVKSEVAAVSAVDSKYAAILNLGFSQDVEKDMANWEAERKAAGYDKIVATYLEQAQAAYNALNG